MHYSPGGMPKPPVRERHVGCAGFPVPVSRYWAELHAVEIAETELGIPGEGTVRRWAREAPAGYGFSLLAPKSIAAGGFAKGKDQAALLDALGDVARKLDAKAIVFAADSKPVRGTKQTLQAFAAWLRGMKLPTAVFDLPQWTHKELAASLEGTGAVAAQDPFRAPPHLDGALAYLRLPGPAGHRSRYDEPALEMIAGQLRASTAAITFCTFVNVDCISNAKRVVELLA
jgi:uncharacterized protein YecE (DUF72 family)